VPGKWFNLDLGVGGSEYDTPIRWTPNIAHGVRDDEFGYPASTLHVLQDNRVGDSFIDFHSGFKVSWPIGERSAAQ